MAFNLATGEWTPDFSEWGGPEGGGWSAMDTIAPATPMGQAIPEYQAARTVNEDWNRFMAELPADPRWRRGFESLSPRQYGRYLLAEPYMGAGRSAAHTLGYAAPEADPDTSFARFLSGMGGYRADRPELLERAQLAGHAARMTVPQLGSIATNPVMQAYYGQFGGGSDEAYQRQLAVANMLARQRAGGGAYRGRLGQAIGRTMSAMAAGRRAQGAPTTDFLSWYLDRLAEDPT